MPEPTGGTHPAPPFHACTNRRKRPTVTSYLSSLKSLTVAGAAVAVGPLPVLVYVRSKVPPVTASAVQQLSALVPQLVMPAPPGLQLCNDTTPPSPPPLEPEPPSLDEPEDDPDDDPLDEPEEDPDDEPEDEEVPEDDPLDDPDDEPEPEDDPLDEPELASTLASPPLAAVRRTGAPPPT